MDRGVTRLPRQRGRTAPDPARRAPPGGPRWQMPVVVAGLVLLLGFTVFPHVWLGYQYVYKSYDVLTTVFVDETTTSTSLVTTTTTGTGSPTSTVPQTTSTTVPAATVNAGDDQTADHPVHRLGRRGGTLGGAGRHQHSRELRSQHRPDRAVLDPPQHRATRP